MASAFKTYRIPIVVTALMVGALTFWSWRVWKDIDGRGRDGERFRATDVSRMLTGALQALIADEYLTQMEIENVLDGIIRNSPYQFFLLEQDGRRLLQVGTVPPALNAGPSREVFPDERFFLFRCKVQLVGRKRQEQLGAPQVSDLRAASLGLGPGEQVMVFGGAIHHDPMYAEAIKGMLVLHTGAVLLLTASFVAWVMAIRSRLLAEQLRAERTRSAHLEDLGLAAAGLAHETKNPLGIISGIAQQIARQPDISESSKSMLEAIIDEVDKSASRLGRFMTFARRQEINPVPLDLERLVVRIGEILQPEFDAAGVSLTVNCPPLMVMADENMLRQILVNLLLNSLQASSPADGVTVRLERQGGLVDLVVADEGRGISPELLPDIFKPYVAGNPNGHGLGLAIVKRFVEEHRWTISAASECGRGTVMTVGGMVPFRGERVKG